MQLTPKEQLARERLCLPLDNLDTLQEVQERIKELSPYVGLFKVGKESFTAFGQKIIELIHSYNSKVFLDLKYHDIPNTVKGACKAAAKLGVSILNVHASGGSEMMQAALEGAKEGALIAGCQIPKLIAVTILTSINEQTMNEELKVPGKLQEQVLHLAILTKQAGLDGVVCSAQDLEHIKSHLPKGFMYVTPGIKGPISQAGSDQKRVMTPYNALQAGSSVLVVGRAITSATDRKQAAYDVLKDMAKVL